MRGLGLIVRKSLLQHRLSTAVTAASMALACGLTSAVFVVRDQAQAAFRAGEPGFHAILGARGSELQIVLNAVFHLETAPGSLPWSWVERLHDDPAVESVLPYVVGDTVRGFRVVGTTPARFEAPGDEVAPWAFAAGRGFAAETHEAVLGSVVAQRTGLGVGDTFQPTHGLVEHAGGEHDDTFTVVGVLAPSGRPRDRVVWAPYGAILELDGHVLHDEHGHAHEAGEEHVPEEAYRVSAVLVRLKSPAGGFRLAQRINREGSEATLAWPVAASVDRLFERLGWVVTVLGAVAYLVLAVAAGSILASLYNAMGERRGEFAVLRALGARRGLLAGAIVVESGVIAALGAVGGLGVHLLIVSTAAAVLQRETGVVLEPWAWHAALLAVPLGAVVLGALAGLLPAHQAYRVDVHEGLGR